MSNCDRSGLNIQNETSLPIKIQGITCRKGTVQDLSVGQSVGPGTTASGRAYSGSGTEGDAQGTLSIQLDGKGEIASLVYSFWVPYKTGNGVCSATGESTKFSSAGKHYEAVVSSVDSGSDRRAGISWRVVEV